MLSFWQPFASLMFYGKVETRPWDTKYRGKILIVSTVTPFEKQPLDKSRHIMLSTFNRFAVGSCRLKEARETYNSFSLNGYAIGVGELVESRLVRPNDLTYFQHQKISTPVFAHVYKDVKRIWPFKLRGFQGRPRLITEEIRNQIKFV